MLRNLRKIQQGNSTDSVADFSIGAAKKLRAWSARNSTILIGVGLLALLVGCAYSVPTLDLKLSDIKIRPLLALVLVLVPITILYSAINMQLMAQAINVPMEFSRAVKTSALAQVAELLPLPGAALVRTAALVGQGGSTLKSASVVTAFGLLWIACAAVGGGIALLSAPFVGVILLVGASALLLATFWWLVRRAGWKVAAIALVLRIVGLALVAIRIATAFQIIGFAVSGVESLIFAFAIILGSAAAIVPAGLGVGESLSALLAQFSLVAPAAAFMATAVNRIAGFLINMLVAGLTLLFFSKTHATSEQKDA